MFGSKKSDESTSGPRVSTRLCTNKFNGKYPHVGLYDCREKKVWIAKPLSGRAIRTSHARLITGASNATSTAWKDRFLCFWFYTPRTGEGELNGHPIDWEQAHLIVRIDPNWDYDRQRMIPTELSDQTNANLARQFKHGESIFDFYRAAKLKYPINLHLLSQRAMESIFDVKRIDAQK